MTKEERRIYNRKWEASHKEARKVSRKAKRQANPREWIARTRAWEKANPEKLKIQRKLRYQKNKEKIAHKLKIRYQTDSYYRLTCNLRNRVRSALANGYKLASTKDLLGASFEIVKEYMRNNLQKV